MSPGRLYTLLWTLIAQTVGAGEAGPGDVSEDGRCGANGETSIVILGSGGPMHGGGRGSAAYLVLHEGVPVAVVDMGGDTPTALARAGIDTDRIDTVMVSHLHPDHVSGLPDFLWGGIVAERSRPLLLIGPSGSETVPGLDTFLERSFGAHGSFPFMAGVLDGDPFTLRTIIVEPGAGVQRAVGVQGGLRFHALGVPHGRTPALAFRVDGPDFRVVFAGDQTARLDAFARFAAGADVLVVHAMLTSRAANSALAEVVALPEDIARQASQARVRHLVLSHLMANSVRDKDIWSLDSMDDVVSAIRDRYSGVISIASDGRCIEVAGQ